MKFSHTYLRELIDKRRADELDRESFKRALQEYISSNPLPELNMDNKTHNLSKGSSNADYYKHDEQEIEKIIGEILGVSFDWRGHDIKANLMILLNRNLPKKPDKNEKLKAMDELIKIIEGYHIRGYKEFAIEFPGLVNRRHWPDIIVKAGTIGLTSHQIDQISKVIFHIIDELLKNETKSPEAQIKEFKNKTQLNQTHFDNEILLTIFAPQNKLSRENIISKIEIFIKDLLLRLFNIQINEHKRLI